MNGYQHFSPTYLFEKKQQKKKNRRVSKTNHTNTWNGAKKKNPLVLCAIQWLWREEKQCDREMSYFESHVLRNANAYNDEERRFFIFYFFF